jgi:hypothetical protein
VIDLGRACTITVRLNPAGVKIAAQNFKPDFAPFGVITAIR